jgi:hypothetical protein
VLFDTLKPKNSSLMRVFGKKPPTVEKRANRNQASSHWSLARSDGQDAVSMVYVKSFNHRARPVPYGMLYSCSECAETNSRSTCSRRNEFNPELPFQGASRLVEGSEGYSRIRGVEQAIHDRRAGIHTQRQPRLAHALLLAQPVQL